MEISIKIAIDKEMVYQEISKFVAEGKTVSAQRSIPEKLRYATLCDLRKEATT